MKSDLRRHPPGGLLLLVEELAARDALLLRLLVAVLAQRVALGLLRAPAKEARVTPKFQWKIIFYNAKHACVQINSNPSTL